MITPLRFCEVCRNIEKWYIFLIQSWQQSACFVRDLNGLHWEHNFGTMPWALAQPVMSIVSITSLPASFASFQQDVNRGSYQTQSFVVRNYALLWQLIYLYMCCLPALSVFSELPVLISLADFISLFTVLLTQPHKHLPRQTVLEPHVQTNPLFRACLKERSSGRWSKGTKTSYERGWQSLPFSRYAL